jgi:hypothetical protein
MRCFICEAVKGGIAQVSCARSGLDALARSGISRMRATMALLIWLLPTAVFSQAKIALLIGNQAYDASVGLLKNSHNDIAVVGEALRAQNFEVLPPIKDAGRSVS